METQRKYGDENTGYAVLSRDMSPKDAKQYLEANMNDGIYMQMNEQRRIALHLRAEDTE